jgi:hypothetical protein
MHNSSRNLRVRIAVAQGSETGVNSCEGRAEESLRVLDRAVELDLNRADIRAARGSCIASGRKSKRHELRLALTQTSSAAQRITTNGYGCACGEANRPAGQLLLSY